MKNITPDNISYLNKNEIFVFGSNEAGKHGKGAAKYAYNFFGAKYGQEEGIQGQSYGIPTKDKNLNVLTVSKIEEYVIRFLEYAKQHKELIFYVTPIGCGLANYSPKDIAPCFYLNCDMRESYNIYFPETFWIQADKYDDYLDNLSIC